MRLAVAVDVLMTVLLLVNLLLLLFEMLFRSPTIAQLFATHAPAFHAFYSDAVHARFVLIDLTFISVYLVELLVRWALAARRRTYAHWWTYPLIHWYDVLGCVPLSAMRFVRILRVGVIIVRLHRLGLIDVRRTKPYRLLERFKNILTEEVSDRVVIKVLDGVQQEIGEGSPVFDQLWRDVFAPRKDQFLRAVATQLEAATKEAAEHHRPKIRRYVDRLLADAFDRENRMPLRSVPVMGGILARQIEGTTRRVIQSVVERFIDDADKIDGRLILDQLERVAAARLPVQDEFFASAVREMAIETLEIVKDQVRVQQWKLAEQPDAPPADPPAAPGPARVGEIKLASDPA